MKTEPATRSRGRPATGQTPKRYFRMDDESWQQIVDAADSLGETISEYLRRVMLRDAKRILKRDE